MRIPNYDITSVEYDRNIAKIYQDYFPDDKIIIGDAHDYLLNHFNEYDIIWSSPPCPTHSRLRTMNKTIVYPDMNLYAEIILLQKWFKGFWVIENVIPYYEPLIKPSIVLHRHNIWCNFKIKNKEFERMQTCQKKAEKTYLEEKLGYNLSGYFGIDKRKVLRNCVVPEMGLYILNSIDQSN